jgi:hypothetical protein
MVNYSANQFVFQPLAPTITLTVRAKQIHSEEKGKKEYLLNT